MSQLALSPQQPHPNSVFAVPEVEAGQPDPFEQEADEAPSELDIRVAHHAPDTVVVHVRGALDQATTARVARVLQPRLESVATTVVVDLSSVEFAGSAVLELLVRAHHQAVQRGMSLRLVAKTRDVRRALHTAERAGAPRFAIYSDVSAAVETPRDGAPAWSLGRTGALAAAHLAGQVRS